MKEGRKGSGGRKVKVKVKVQVKVEVKDGGGWDLSTICSGSPYFNQSTMSRKTR